MLLGCQAMLAQPPDSANDPAKPKPAASKAVEWVFNYLSMAGAKTAADFHPLTQRERNAIYGKSLINPVLYLKVAASAGIDQWKAKPEEWELGASGYGKRSANILGQYAIQRTITFGLSSALHEDNRYFGSGKQGIWPRTRYAVSSSILARHDNGKRYVSVSQIAGFAGAAFISRTWQPASTDSAGDAAVSFGISMSSNIAFSVLKEFLPDLVRPILKGHKP
jgi:hypothetical protein